MVLHMHIGIPIYCAMWTQIFCLLRLIGSKVSFHYLCYRDESHPIYCVRLLYCCYYNVASYFLQRAVRLTRAMITVDVRIQSIHLDVCVQSSTVYTV